MEWLKTIILGIIQGITEWLPVSSTGHMILFNEFFPLKQGDNFVNVFMVFIQTASALAVVILYFNKLNPFQKERKNVFSLYKKLIVASLPAIVFGLLLSNIIEDVLSSWIVIVLTLFIYGVVFLIIERKSKKADRDITFDEISYKDSFLLGLFQVLSLIPGTSRSGSVIIGGRIIGLKGEVVTEFSFFMAIPVLLGAAVLRLSKYGFYFTSNEWSLLIVGFIVSFVVSFFTMKALVNFVKTHSLKVFGYYRIVLSIAVSLSFLLS